MKDETVTATPDGFETVRDLQHQSHGNHPPRCKLNEDARDSDPVIVIDRYGFHGWNVVSIGIGYQSGGQYDVACPNAK